MRRPPAFDWVLGHPRARVLLYCATFVAVFLLLDHPDPVPAAVTVLCILLGSYARKATGRITSYRQWKQSWDQMAGVDPAPAAARARLRRRSGWVAVAVTAWALSGLWLFGNPQQSGSPAYGSLALGFGGLSLWGSLAILLPIVRRVRDGRMRKGDAGEFIVRVLPPIPRSAPSLSSITSQLPDYCRRLMTGGSGPP